MQFPPQPVRLPDGREFPSIAATARALKLSPSRVGRALDEGSLSSLGKGRGHNAVKIKVNGVVHHAIWRAAAATDMHRDRLAYHYTKAANSNRRVFRAGDHEFEIIK